MWLNLDVLASCLPAPWHIKKYGVCKKTLNLPRPLLYDPGMEVTEGALYLAWAEALSQSVPEVPCSMICVGRCVPKAWLVSGIPLLHISEAVSIAEVYNRVQQTFDTFDRWDSGMRDELEKEVDFDIRKLLLLASDFLHRMINVVDSNLQQLFCVGFDIHNGAYILDLHGSMPMEHNERIKEVCALERVIREPYQTALEIEGRAYCQNLYVSDQFCGCISINEESRPFQPWEFPVIEHFFLYFQKAYFKYLRACGRQENAALSALRKAFAGHVLSDEEQKLLHLEQEEAWLCFELCEHINERTLPVDYMYATLSAAFPQKVYAILYQEKIVGILRTQRQNPYSPDTLEPFSDMVFRMGYYAGLSNPFSALSALRDYLRQADYALRQISDTPQKLYLFCDCALCCVLDMCLTEFPIESLLSQGLQMLLEHDQLKSSEYVRTLDLYLQNEMSVSRTAEALFIHRSSLLKRLDKIYRILGSTLDSPDERLYLRLCIALLRREKQ